MPELTLATLANLAEVIGATSIVTGMIFGAFQIRHYRKQQIDAIAANLTRTFYSRDLAAALSLLQPLPDGITLTELRAMGDRYPEAAITVATSFETMGLLVFKRIAPLSLVSDLAGGIINTMAKKLARWLEDMRIEQEQPSWAEWFEWLGDQCDRVKSNEAPAYIRYRDWRP